MISNIGLNYKQLKNIEELNMIRYKNIIFQNYFINPKTGEITDVNGNVQELKLRGSWLSFKGMHIHMIQMHTNFEVRDGRKWAIHHKDFNKMNNSIENLEYVTHSEHSKIHGENYSDETRKIMSEKNTGKNNPMYGRKHSPETIQKIKNNTPVKRGKEHPMYGKKHTEEAKNKISLANKGKHLSEDHKNKLSEKLSGRIVKEKTKKLMRNKKWFTNGIDSVFCEPEKAPIGYKKGRIIKKIKEIKDV